MGVPPPLLPMSACISRWRLKWVGARLHLDQIYHWLCLFLVFVIWLTHWPSELPTYFPGFGEHKRLNRTYTQVTTSATCGHLCHLSSITPIVLPGVCSVKLLDIIPTFHFSSSVWCTIMTHVVKKPTLLFLVEIPANSCLVSRIDFQKQSLKYRLHRRGQCCYCWCSEFGLWLWSRVYIIFKLELMWFTFQTSCYKCAPVFWNWSGIG